MRVLRILLLLTWVANVSPAADRPPNIIVILADDFGVGDIQTHYPDNKIPTPYLDKLVREGISYRCAQSFSRVFPDALRLADRPICLAGQGAKWVVAAYEPPLMRIGPRSPVFSVSTATPPRASANGIWLELAGPRTSKMTEAPNGQSTSNGISPNPSRADRLIVASTTSSVLICRTCRRLPGSKTIASSPSRPKNTSTIRTKAW